MKILFLIAFLALSGCGSTKAIYKALKYPCPGREVPRPEAVDKEPLTLRQLQAQSQVRLLYGDAWVEAYRDCAE